MPANLDWPLAWGVSVSQIQNAIRPAQQTASPLTGATILCQDPGTDLDLWLTPAGPIAALTVTLPAGFNGMRVNISSNQTISILTVNGATNIFGALNILSPGDSFEMVRVGTQTWVHPV